ncbi:MAG: hypothetical protein PHX34_03830 [Candidatus Shapirobacteria bacterium]|nr:hypothetical protein [Candidatus Shapirobacteria bacterium]
MSEISPNSPEINQTLKHKEYRPKQTSVSGKEITEKQITGDTVIYFGGTFENPDSKSTEDLKQSWADYSSNICYSFLATADPEEVLKFIKEKGLTNIVLTGYSQGAMRAVELARILEKNNQIKINGLVLLEPTSLYKQENLSKKFISEISKTVESFGKYKKSSRKTYEEKELIKKGKYLLEEGVTIGIPKLIDVKGKNGLPLKDQIKNMSSVHPDLDKIKSKIVIIQGNDDAISNPKKTNLEVFGKNKNVFQITGDYLNTHFLPMFRSEQIAKVGLGQLHRL